MDSIAAVLLTIAILVILVRCLRPNIVMMSKVQRGEPFSTMIYTDESGGKLLISEEYDLQGKPDYIFKTWLGGRYIPFEIKSGENKENWPHDGDLMQLLAYFLIIEEAYGKKPPYGKLVYSNKTFKVRNTLRHRMLVKSTLKEMRHMLKSGQCQEEVTKAYIKCKNCICQHTVCECEEED